MATAMLYHQLIQATQEEERDVDEQAGDEEEEEEEIYVVPDYEDYDAGNENNNNNNDDDDEEGEEDDDSGCDTDGDDEVYGGFRGGQPQFKSMTQEQIKGFQLAHLDPEGCSADTPRMSVPHNVLMNYVPMPLEEDFREEELNKRDMEKEKEGDEDKKCLICKTREEMPSMQTQVIQTFDSIMGIYDKSPIDKADDPIFDDMKEQFNENLYKPLTARGIQCVRMTKHLLRRHFSHDGGCGYHPKRVLKYFIKKHKDVANNIRKSIRLVNPVTKKEIIDHKAAHTYDTYVERICKMTFAMIKMDSGLAPSLTNPSSSSSSRSSGGGNSSTGGGGRTLRKIPTKILNQEKRGLQFFG